jgi:hypothetical protein
MRRLLLSLGFALCSLYAQATSLHEQPIGSRVSGSFALGPKHIYVPAGDWLLIARHSWTGSINTVMQGSSFAGVYLAEVKEGRLTRAIQAFTNVEPSLARRWRESVDPCKQREKALVYRDLSQNIDNQFCFDVTELRGYMRSSTGWRREAQQWLAEHQIKAPPTAMMVRFAKLDRAFWTELFYYFDARELSPDAARDWAVTVAGQVRAGLTRSGP